MASPASSALMVVGWRVRDGHKIGRGSLFDAIHLTREGIKEQKGAKRKTGVSRLGWLCNKSQWKVESWVLVILLARMKFDLGDSRQDQEG